MTDKRPPALTASQQIEWLIAFEELLQHTPVRPESFDNIHYKELYSIHTSLDLVYSRFREMNDIHSNLNPSELKQVLLQTPITKESLGL